MTTTNYDCRTNPVYQIDFATSSKGKRLSLSKRCISFRFGFSNAEAIEYGQRGMYCRGEEHEVTLTWSLTSGKRLVKVDNKQVHFSMGKRTDLKFECTFQIKGNRTVRLIANATPSMMSATIEFRQFDMFIDGLSFFDMPRIFELGDNCHQPVVEDINNNEAHFGPPSNVPESNNFTRNNIYQYSAADASINLSEPHTYPQIRSDMTIRSETSPNEATPLPDPTYSRASSHFDTPLFVQQPASISSPTLMPLSPTANTLPFTNNAHANEFTPISPPSPTLQDISYRVMNTHEEAPSKHMNLAIDNGPSTESIYSPMNDESQITPFEREHSQPLFVSSTYANTTPPFSPTPPPVSSLSYISTVEYTENVTPSQDSLVSSIATPECTENLSMKFIQSLTQESPNSIRQLDELSLAMQNLVNFEHMCEPLETPLKLTMKEAKETNKPSNKSQGLPPVKVAWHLGAQATLADIKANVPSREASTKEVMRINPVFDPAPPQTAMTFVHGEPVTNQPPSFQKSFGYNAYSGSNY